MRRALDSTGCLHDLDEAAFQALVDSFTGNDLHVINVRKNRNQVCARVRVLVYLATTWSP